MQFLTLRMIPRRKLIKIKLDRSSIFGKRNIYRPGKLMSSEVKVFDAPKL